MPPAHAPSCATEAPAAAAPLALLILASMIQPLGMTMYVPAMADMQSALATSAAAIGATLSAYLAFTAIGQIVVGPVSDIYGRRPVMVGGLGLFVVGSVICALAPNVTVLILGRIVQAWGACAGIAISRAIVRDVHGAERSASMIGYVTMGLATAPLVAPALGGLIHETSSWRMTFVAMAAIGFAVLLAAAVRLCETHEPVRGGGVFRRWRAESVALLRERLFWIYASVSGFLSVAFFAFVAGGAFVSEEVFDLTASQYGLYFVFGVVGYIAGNFVTGRFGAHIGLNRMVVIGNMVALGGVLLGVALALAGGGHPLTFFAPMLVVGLGNGFALPNCVAGAVSVRPELAGTAAGLSGAFQIGAGAVASVVVGLLIDAGTWPGTAWPVISVMLAGSVVSLAVCLSLARRR